MIGGVADEIEKQDYSGFMKISECKKKDDDTKMDTQSG